MKTPPNIYDLAILMDKYIIWRWRSEPNGGHLVLRVLMPSAWTGCFSYIMFLYTEHNSDLSLKISDFLFFMFFVILMGWLVNTWESIYFLIPRYYVNGHNYCINYSNLLQNCILPLITLVDTFSILTCKTIRNL